MFAKSLIPALAAVAGLASAQSDPCSQDTFTINSQADISKLSTCRTLKGNVVVGTSTDSSLDFSGFSSVQGDFSVLNNKLLTNLKSSSISSISGAFHLQNLTALSNLGFTSLTSCGSINFVTLNFLDTLNFGSTGVQSAKSVVIADTFLSSLNGLNMGSVDTMNINNNKRLVTYTSPLGNLTDNLNINANGLNFKVSFPNLIWISNMTISNVSTFDAPSLATVNGSMRFDSNFFTNFSAPNLTSTTSGDISFVSNPQLVSISMPQLTAIGGGFLIANNTALGTVQGFPKLTKVGGAVKLRGSFTQIDFPKLNDVKGAFDVISTKDIKSSCDKFAQLSSNGGGGQIQGNFTCDSNNANANQDTSSGGSGGSGGGNGNSAAGIAINMASVLGLTALGLVFQTML